MRAKTLQKVAAGVLALAFATAASAENDRPVVERPAVDRPVLEHPVVERPVVDWPVWGRDPGGTRFAPLADITRENVHRLEVAWTARTGHMDDAWGEVTFEVTPILVDATLYLCTPQNQVLALDPETGAERWRYDAKIDRSGKYANQLVCRGVSFWRDPQAAAGARCARRIFMGTNDARLIALDAATGKPCSAFGAGGEVDLNPGAGEQWWKGEYQVTSPPTLAESVVIVGAAVADGVRTDAPSGVVRAFDARSGSLRWAFDLAPPGIDREQVPTSPAGYVLGTPNVWAPMSVDTERGLVFLPTGNPSPDFSRDTNLDYYGSSVVALDASTGEPVWNFQTVHHDVWDYDVPAQPTLGTLEKDGSPVPAVIQGTKMGFLFVLDRETGEPLFAVEERPVPQSGAPGEALSPTQPIPTRPPPLVEHALAPDDAWGFTFLDKFLCRMRIDSLHTEGFYTPPSLEATLLVPGNAGGINWGGVALDPGRQLAVSAQTNLPFVVTLFPREEFEQRRRDNPGVEIAPQQGRPHSMRREVLLSTVGAPCSPPPWGTLAATDLRTGKIRWQVSLGTIEDAALLPIERELGTPVVGGPMVTAGGLVFVAATRDPVLRAFDIETGKELWKAPLPASGHAIPMTYRARPGGRQYVVIAAGGDSRAETKLGDHVVAFALPDDVSGKSPEASARKSLPEPR